MNCGIWVVARWIFQSFEQQHKFSAQVRWRSNVNWEAQCSFISTDALSSCPTKQRFTQAFFAPIKLIQGIWSCPKKKMERCHAKQGQPCFSLRLTARSQSPFLFLFVAVYYSTYGHIAKLAQAIKEGVDSVEVRQLFCAQLLYYSSVYVMGVIRCWKGRDQGKNANWKDEKHRWQNLEYCSFLGKVSSSNLNTVSDRPVVVWRASIVAFALDSWPKVALLLSYVGLLCNALPD